LAASTFAAGVAVDDAAGVFVDACTLALLAEPEVDAAPPSSTNSPNFGHLIHSMTAAPPE
jgi:hypothetical protein